LLAPYNLNLLTKDIRCCLDPGFCASPQELPLQALSRPYVLCAACFAGLEQALDLFDFELRWP